MKKGPSYTLVIWIFGLMLLVLAYDAYNKITESLVPIWRTEWFLWRASALLLIFVGIIIYLYYRAVERMKKEFEEFKTKIIESQEKDWKIIAGELHDSIGQNLSAINIFLHQNLKKINEGITDNEGLGKASDLIVETLDEVRRISQRLYPKQIERLGLTVSIEAMVKRLTETTGMNISCSTENIDSFLSKENEVQYFRVIQELLNNVIKHADAGSVNLNIRRSKIFIITDVEDNGVGFDTSEKIGTGFGLMNIDERIRILKGTYDIKSAIGKGTKFRITIPFR
jgi:two-component system, sensor histidine kinase LadS